MRLRILLMTDHRNRAALLESALTAARHQVLTTIRVDDDLSFYVRQVKPDALIVGLVAPDPGLLQQLQKISRENPLPIIVFAERADSVPLRTAIKAGVSAYVVDGLQIARVGPVLEAAMLRFREYQALRAERDKALAQVSARRNIERAKNILMNRRGLVDKEAFNVLNQMAAAAGKSLAMLAQQIVSVEATLLGQEALPDTTLNSFAPVTDPVNFENVLHGK
ncbi:MAG: ANTAR domain-containing protein [Gammaproteobacteria bacterium]|nr:ANTAR domain-containing protein [Gammaproteobacteria bacterium]